MESDAQYVNLLENYNEFVSIQDGYTGNVGCFGPLSNINILIGKNNSHKSRFLRAILDEGTFYSNENILKLKAQLKELSGSDFSRFGMLASNTKNPNGDFSDYTFLESNDFKGQVKNINAHIDKVSAILDRLVVGDPKSAKAVSEYAGNILTFIDFIIHWCAGDFDQHRIEYIADIRVKKAPIDIQDPLLVQVKNILTSLYNYKVLKPIKSIVYIPILRSAVNYYRNQSDSDEGANKLDEDIYAATLHKNYRIKSDSRVEIFTGRNLYSDILEARSSSIELQDRHSSFEKFLANSFFDKKAVRLFSTGPKSSQKSIMVSIGKTEWQLHHLGDGIQNIVILMYPFFIADKGTLLLVEEPETHLHPGYQRILLNAIRDQVDSGRDLRCFITTHSNHFLDLTTTTSSDVSVFRFSPSVAEPNQTEIIRVYDRAHSVLHELGVSNSSVLMANCSIWVEGITDRIILEAYLNAYCTHDCRKRPSLDGDYTYFEYGGSNILHYDFSLNIDRDKSDDSIRAYMNSNGIFLLADKDSNDKRTAMFKYLKQLRGSHFHFATTGVVEIENTFSTEVLKKIILHLRHTADESKLQAINQDNYKSTRLGSYLMDYYKRNNIDSPSLVGTRNKSGTLSTIYKKRFAMTISHLVSSGAITWDEIRKNRSAQRITRELHTFILERGK